MSATIAGLGFRWRLAFSKHLPEPTHAAKDHVSASVTKDGDTDPRLFEAFFWRFERQIIGYLYRMTGDEQSALDLSQETFLRAWQHFATLTTPPQSRSWLFRVATNLALNHLRRRAARPMVSLTEQEPGKSDPGRRIVEQDLILHTLQQLTPKQRSALLLHEVHGHSCEEVAILLGISRDAVKMSLRRARQQFRLLYVQEEGGE